MWYVFNSVFNKKDGTKYDLRTRRSDTFDDARAYIRDKTNKYTDFCVNVIESNSYIEDYGDDVFFNFLGIRVTFDIVKASYDF